MSKKPKTINGLMKHLRSNGVNIKNSKQKTQLINQGYYHGYKGYRFYKESSRKLPITDYEQINQTILYDNKLKNLLYSKIMFIETALKNICLDTIISELNSDDPQDMYKYAIESFNNCPPWYNRKQKETAQEKLLRLESMVHSNITKAYKKNNPKITHFYNNMLYTNIPLWAIFEIMTMGDFGQLLSSLTFDMRDKLTRKIGFRISVDSNRELVYKYVYTLKDLRNAIAHNDVIYDARFNKITPSNAMKQCLIQEFGLQYVNFEDIIDYLALIVYIQKLLHVSKTEQKAFIKEFEVLTNDYIKSVGTSISSITINNNWKHRLKVILNYI